MCLSIGGNYRRCVYLLDPHQLEVTLIGHCKTHCNCFQQLARHAHGLEINRFCESHYLCCFVARPDLVTVEEAVLGTITRLASPCGALDVVPVYCPVCDWGMKVPRETGGLMHLNGICLATSPVLDIGGALCAIGTCKVTIPVLLVGGPRAYCGFTKPEMWICLPHSVQKLSKGTPEHPQATTEVIWQ